MKSIVKKINTIFIIAVLLSCAGCINYAQETRLNEDLSGRIEMCFTINAREGFRMMAGEAKDSPEVKQLMTDMADKADIEMKTEVKEEDVLGIFNPDAIKRKDHRKFSKDGVGHFYFTVEFDDITKLYKNKKRVTLADDGKGNIVYREYLEPPGSGGKEGADAPPPEIFKGFHFKYTLHMPRDIISANTDKISGNTAVWDLPLQKVLDTKNFYITATFKGQNIFQRLLNRLKRRKAI